MIAILSSKLFFKSVLIINTFMVLLPVFFLFNSALRETNSFASNPFSLARDPHWENFQQVWSDGAFATYIKNSLIVTGGSLIVIHSRPIQFQRKCLGFWIYLNGNAYSR